LVVTLSQKVGGLRSLKATEFKKWGELEPSSLIEVYTYAKNDSSHLAGVKLLAIITLQTQW